MARRWLVLPGLLTGMALACGAAPVRVRVGVYVLNLGKFEVATGSYTVDFYLSLRADEPVDMDQFGRFHLRPAPAHLGMRRTAYGRGSCCGDLTFAA